MTAQHEDLRALQRVPTPGAGFARAPVPQPSSRWLSRILFPTLILLAAGGTLAYAARDALRPRIPVHVAAVVPRVFAAPSAPDALGPDAAGLGPAPLGQVVAQAPGWVEPAPFPIAVPALAEGVVREVLVLEGETVAQGQVVVRLIDEDARLALRAAEAMVQERTAEVARASAAIATAQSMVRVGQLEADEVRDEVTRKRELLGIGGVSEGELRRLELRLAAAQARIVSAEREVDEARAMVEQVRATLHAAMVDHDIAALTLARTEIRSPAPGVVMARLVEPGSRVSMGTPVPTGEGGMSGAVLRIYDPARLQVRVDVPIADAAGVGVGTRAVVTTEALPDAAFTGAVSRVVHEANIQRNTVQFKVALDAPSPVLKPEMLTRVKLHAAGASGGAAGPDSTASGGDFTLLVPQAAVIAGAEGRGSVWVVDRTSGLARSAQRAVAIRPSSEAGFVVVTAGLGLTDRVILDPASHPGLRPGALLRIVGEQPTTQTEEAP